MTVQPSYLDGGLLGLSPDELARLVAESKKRAEKYGPVDAEIVAGIEARWHLLEIYPNHENIASAHLAARRFAIYVPRVRTYSVDSVGRPCVRSLPMFPGYLPVLVWDVGRHVQRIRACPGVRSIMCEGNRIFELKHEFIYAIQWLEYICDETMPKPKKTRRRYRKQGDDADSFDDGLVRIYTKGLEEALDGKERNQLLRNALCLS